MTALDLSMHDQVKFAGDRYWWTVRAVDDRFAVLTRHTPFNKDGDVTYTIIDAERGLRGPCNLIGQGWDFDPERPELGANELLRALVAGVEGPKRRQREHEATGRTSWPVVETEVEISHRNNVAVNITERRAA